MTLWKNAQVSHQVKTGRLFRAPPPNQIQVRFKTSTSDSDSEEEDDRLGDPVRISKSEKFDLVPGTVSGGLGTVIMNLQQTAQDGKMTLRLFGKSDDILRMLLPELGFGSLAIQTRRHPKPSEPPSCRQQ